MDERQRLMRDMLFHNAAWFLTPEADTDEVRRVYRAVTDSLAWMLHHALNR